jgi:dipeptidase D
MFFTVSVEYESVPEAFVAHTLMIYGLLGGHSGVDIHRGRANANVLMGHLLNILTDVCDVRISYIGGGSAKNAIPRESKVVLLFAEDSLEQMQTAVDEMQTGFGSVFPHDMGLKLTFEQTDVPDSAMTADTMRSIISTLLLVPNGVQSMSPHIEGLVQTSSNLGVVTYRDAEVVMTAYLRSSATYEQEMVIGKAILAASAASVQIAVNRHTEPWVFREHSPLRNTMTAVYQDFFGRDPILAAVHAGLETAIFAAAMPDADLISIGPDIVDVHSPDERMNIPSFHRIMGFLVRVLETI